MYDHYRYLSFLDDDGASIIVGEELTGFVVAHAVLTVASFVAFIQGIYETRRKHYLYDRHSLRYFFPWAAFCQMCENLVLAIEVSGNSLPQSVTDIVYVLESTAAPCLLLSTFDVTYCIHKTRHIPFCGVYDGQTHTKNPKCTLALKMSIRVIALGLLSMSIIANFGLIGTTSPYAGRTGWYWIITEPWNKTHVHVLLELMPFAVLALANIYFSIALWRYGTSYSMDVHASPFNPWFTPFFGTMALICGQWFGPRWFPLLSNLGIFVFVESILLLFREVNRDMEAATELREFLACIGKSKNKLTTRLNKKVEANYSNHEDDNEAMSWTRQLQGSIGELEMTETKLIDEESKE